MSLALTSPLWRVGAVKRGSGCGFGRGPPHAARMTAQARVSRRNGRNGAGINCNVQATARRCQCHDETLRTLYDSLLTMEWPMKAEKDSVVTFHYKLTDDAGTVVDSSNEREPLVILFGHGAIIPGLEQAIEGHAAGDRFDVVVPPEQAYGLRRENFTQRVPKKYFQDADRLQPGMSTVLSTQEG